MSIGLEKDGRGNVKSCDVSIFGQRICCKKCGAISLRLCKKPKNGGAEIVHFSECALSGYGGANHDTLDGFDWDTLRAKTQEIMALAATLKLWVALGSMHQLTPPNKPHNSLYLINPQGRIENRYDKRFCTQGDLDYYTPGSRFVTFDLNGVRCSLLDLL